MEKMLHNNYDPEHVVKARKACTGRLDPEVQVREDSFPPLLAREDATLKDESEFFLADMELLQIQN